MSRGSKDYAGRSVVIIAMVVVVALVYIGRLAHLQLFSDEYERSADRNAQYKKTIYPERGLIYDRHGEVLAYNSVYYDLMVTPREMKGLDTLSFCRQLNITREDFDKRMKALRNRRLNPGYSSYTPQLFLSQLSVEQCAPLQEQLFNYPGFSLQRRSLRSYARQVAAHALGYVGEVNRKDLENDAYYVAGDYSGRSGVERMYEKQLRGEKGYELYLRDVHGRIKGSYANGNRDLSPVSGKDLTLSLDADLQAYAEQLMQNKRGAVVAIEPSSGEILCYVSAPSYQPSLLVGNQSSANYKELGNSPYKIFLNRPIQSFYPPGSTFKPLQGLILLQEGIINEHSRYACQNGYAFAGMKLGCHSHESPMALSPAISTSCNAYFAAAYRAMVDDEKYASPQASMAVWRNHVTSFGFGSRLGVDLAYEQPGFIPDADFYDKRYGKRGWKGATIISNSIGQGEILATPLQIANFCATIANRGWYYTPHMVKAIEDEQIDEKYTTRHRVSVDSIHFEPIIQGMRGAVTASYGTSRGVAIPGIEVCGKTGTAQNAGVDHSIFMCFAPKDNPQIAMLVFIENGGFGATWAVPMASLLLEQYLNGEIAPNRRWMETRLLNANLMEVELEQE
ncbi:MAG: penicillin-binding protein 2 [Bacteroidales bacterium]|nr:penicillin-binding protein 2 [Bacteroidales bacterium]